MSWRVLLFVTWLGAQAAWAQLPAPPPEVDVPEEEKEAVAPPPSRVDVRPVADDEAIARRIREVLVATGWYIDPRVRVQDGVVFLSGQTKTLELRKWAGDLARNTQDVAGVANQLELVEPPFFDWDPVLTSLRGLWRDVLTALPFVGIALLVLGFSLGAALLTTRLSRRVLRTRIEARLLRGVVAGALGAFVFLAGVYVILRVSGLTQLAMTVVGGTGLLGLVLGIAFRDITENFLASIFLSLQRPFMTGDLVEVAQVTGYVQQLNLRVTVIMTLEGNLVQVPNSTIYKSTVRNFTANTNRREDFVVGVGYDDSIAEAQEIALEVLLNHPAVLKTPEPAVLADNLGPATVNLRVYFWLDGREHSWLKVRSSVIRLVKRAFQERGISMPDESREVIFPRGIAVTVKSDDAHEPSPQPEGDSAEHAVQAEAGLESEARSIGRQAQQVRPLDDQENLLNS